jgi:hypothetical protein
LGEIETVYGSSKEPDFLKNLHKKIIDVLSANSYLDDILQKLHNYNMREIIDVISRLIVSGFFSKKMIEDLRPDSNSTRFFKDDRQAIITTYLRGPFCRYRGPSDDYPVKMINIFDVPSILNSSDMLITVRAMQMLRRIDDMGSQAQRICDQLDEIGYKPGDTKIAIGFLARYGFILDVGKQKAWGKDASVCLEGDDRFSLAPAGQYLLEDMFNKFAFRYCEAIAYTMSCPRNDSKPWLKETHIVAQVENVIGILKLLVAAAKEEQRRIKSSHKIEDSENFRHKFLSGAKGSNFLINMTIGCLERVRFYKSDAYRSLANFQEQNRVRNLYEQIEYLKLKAVEIKLEYFKK